MPRIAILYPTDLASHVPSGIDSFIRGMLKSAPADLSYTLIGATADPVARPVGRHANVDLGGQTVSFLPVCEMDSEGRRSRIPLTVRYMAAARRCVRQGDLSDFDILDFHRIEPLLLFRSDERPKNLYMHQDMVVIRDPRSDILWRHAPWLYEWCEARLLKRVDRIFCVRRSAVDRYRKQMPERADRFQFTPTWVDSAQFYPTADPVIRAAERAALRLQLRLPDDAEIAGFVGRLDRQKDPLLLIEAVAPLLQSRPQLHVVLVGDGVLRSEVEGSIARQELSARFSLTGALRSAQIAILLRASDVFVLSSAYEGMPIAVLEALASGLPVVSTPVGEVPPLIRNGVNGVVSRDRSAGAFADALGAVLSAVPPLAAADCVDSISAYQPRNVLAALYDNHRRQYATCAGHVVPG